MCKYSIIIPAYKIENYLEKCINSILMQSYADFEVLVIDDGSPDNSGKIADSFAERDNRVKVIHQENKGPGGARNTGIDNAQGEYIWFIDGDDYISEDALAVCDREIESNKSDCVVFNFVYTDCDGKVLSFDKGGSIYGYFDSVYSHPEFILSSPAPWNKIIKKSLFTDNNIFFPNRKFYEDFNTISKLYPFMKSISYVNADLYYYVQRGGSTMNQKRLDHEKDILEMAENIIDFYKAHDVYKNYQCELEALMVEHVYILASVRVVKCDIHSELLNEYRCFIHTNFKNFRSNKYIKQMSAKNKLILKLIEYKSYKLLKNMLTIKSSIN